MFVRARQCALLLLVVAATSACGQRHLEPADFIVRNGPRLPDAAELTAAPAELLESPSGKIRRPSARGRPAAATSPMGTLEAQDPILGPALLALSVAPDAALHCRAAARYRELGIHDAAFDHYYSATRLNPAESAAYEGLARIWRDWGFPHLGLGDASRSVYYSPQWAQAHNTLGTLLAGIGRWTDARRAYGRALALEPRAAYVLSNLCYLSFLEGEPSNAVTECRAALDIEPRMNAARNNLALAYAATRRTDLAAQEFLASGDKAAALYNMGIVRLAGRQYAYATEAFEAASRERPAWVAALERARKSRLLAATADSGSR